MSKIGLICDATVPKGMLAKITIKEDIDNDNKFENEATQVLKDGKYIYELDGFQGDRDNTWNHSLTLGRDPDGPNLSPTRDNPQPPGISRFQIIVSGPPESNEVDPKAVVHKFSEMDFFLCKMKTGESEGFRYYLGGFLNAAYSIDDMLRNMSETEWSDWADTQGKIDLHEMLINSRHQSVHLGSPARGSLKPPLGHSLAYDFGDSAEDSKINRTYFFDDVPISVINEFVPENERIEIADKSKSMRDSPFARIVPAASICQVYLSMVQDYITDWIDELDGDNFSYDLHSLK
ncbi:unknown [Haloarcula marismortui ATCC 43049]|uniref:Uncharacterized protein n=1 Tax=Haloarcula marismortui (strain ATCC 43049 / DSM 3752 / JCM 8966 / VKM B-1809) TaxID=272569 RepID=Q5V266_HALMA|nr:hypothetical protein [Haloarcula marismortui]AAV46386.1 unknown [Haloarcula marismortui ATCC 43049]QCP91118.1 hypothetical protein E6P14_09700 [Haloarcula marismortui ATCC 43049]